MTPRFTTAGLRVVKVMQQTGEFTNVNITGPSFNAVSTLSPIVTTTTPSSFANPDLVEFTATGTNLLPPDTA